MTMDRSRYPDVAAEAQELAEKFQLDLRLRERQGAQGVNPDVPTIEVPAICDQEDDIAE